MSRWFLMAIAKGAGSSSGGGCSSTGSHPVKSDTSPSSPKVGLVGGTGGSRAMVASIAKVASRAPESRAMLEASFPEGSSKPISAPAAIRSLQMTALLRAADSMRGVWPLESRALRLSPRWMWIWMAVWTPATTAILRNGLRTGAYWSAMSPTRTLLPGTRTAIVMFGRAAYSSRQPLQSHQVQIITNSTEGDRGQMNSFLPFPAVARTAQACGGASGQADSPTALRGPARRVGRPRRASRCGPWACCRFCNAGPRIAPPARRAGRDVVGPCAAQHHPLGHRRRQRQARALRVQQRRPAQRQPGARQSLIKALYEATWACRAWATQSDRARRIQASP